MYNLILKSSNEIVDSISSKSLDEAKLFYMARKQMNKESFNKIYEVKTNVRK